jgi:hypothetical protein
MAAMASSCVARVVAAAAAARPTQQRQQRGVVAVVGGRVKGLGGASALGGMRSGRSGCAAAAALSRSEGVAMAAGKDEGVAVAVAVTAAAAAATGAAEENATGVADKPFDYALASTALMATFAIAFWAEPASAADLAAQMGDVSADGMPHELCSVAGSEIPFWANMVKYVRFSISIMVRVDTFHVILQRIFSAYCAVHCTVFCKTLLAAACTAHVTNLTPGSEQP